MLGGGTDSWNILKICEKNDIFIDEVMCCLVSFDGNRKSNIEYLPALQYAKQLEKTVIGNLILKTPTKEDLSFIDDPDWYKNTNGPSIPQRPMIFNIARDYLNRDDRYITLTGLEKPSIKIENGQVFWTSIDHLLGEWMGINNHCPLWLDKSNPELIVAMTYGFVDNLPQHYFKNDGFYTYDNLQDKNLENKLLNFWNLKTEKTWLNHHYIGKRPFDDNLKNRYFKKEVREIGREDFIIKWKQDIKKIYNTYKKIPYGLIKNNDKIHTVGRFCQKIPIFQDSFGS